MHRKPKQDNALKFSRRDAETAFFLRGVSSAALVALLQDPRTTVVFRRRLPPTRSKFGQWTACDATDRTASDVAIRNEMVILRCPERRPFRTSCSTSRAPKMRSTPHQHRWARHCARILRTAIAYLPRGIDMATGSKSSGSKARRKSTTSKRATARTKTAAKSAKKTAAGSKRKSAPKVAARSGTARKPAAKRSTTRARKQSTVTRIKRVATTVLQQGATAAKQSVEAVERLVEGVKDRVTS